jgi:hypothetical protein
MGISAKTLFLGGLYPLFLMELIFHRDVLNSVTLKKLTLNALRKNYEY